MRTRYNAATGQFRPVEQDLPLPSAEPVIVNGKPFVVPPLETRRLLLRPIALSDYEFLQAAELQGDLAVRWRFAGGTPSPEQWLQRTWSGVLAQYLAVDRATGDRVGLLICYKPDMQHGHAYVAATRLGESGPSPTMMVATALFLRYVLTCWNFRKLYMEVPEYNHAQFASGDGSLFEIEGRLRDHYFHGGQYWDQLTLAVYRDATLVSCDQLLQTVDR